MGSSCTRTPLNTRPFVSPAGGSTVIMRGNSRRGLLDRTAANASAAYAAERELLWSLERSQARLTRAVSAGRIRPTRDGCVKKRCPTCAHLWYDKHKKNGAPPPPSHSLVPLSHPELVPRLAALFLSSHVGPSFESSKPQSVPSAWSPSTQRIPAHPYAQRGCHGRSPRAHGTRGASRRSSPRRHGRGPPSIGPRPAAKTLSGAAAGMPTPLSPTG